MFRPDELVNGEMVYPFMDGMPPETLSFAWQFHKCSFRNGQGNHVAEFTQRIKENATTSIRRIAWTDNGVSDSTWFTANGNRVVTVTFLPALMLDNRYRKRFGDERRPRVQSR